MSRLLKNVIQSNKALISNITRHASTNNDGPRILITGGLGQLGTSLADVFTQKYGKNTVVVTDINTPNEQFLNKGLEYKYCDVLDSNELKKTVANYKIDWIIHFSALLSAVGEKNVPLAISVNINGMQNILEVGKQFGCKVFIPSTIGAFGPESPRDPTPDFTIQRPKTIYGVSKVYAELLGEYYAHRYNLDFRCLRFPGVISATEPGGGTTDYAVKVFYDALRTGEFECYLEPNTKLPMMYIDDCLDSVVKFMEYPVNDLKQRTYNVTAFSFTPEELFREIKNHLPDLKITYKVDNRQSIADSWPKSFDDSNARAHWNWNPKIGTVKELVDKMFTEVQIDNFCKLGNAVNF